MELRQALRDRALRRAASTHGNDRAAAETLAARIDAGDAVNVSLARLKSALWEADLATADELAVMQNAAAAEDVRLYRVEADGSFAPA